MWIGAYCFNLLPQLRWHIVNDERPYTTAEPKTPICVHCFSLSRCFYCLGYTAHHKATNTATQPTEEFVLNNCWLILSTVLSCFYSIALTKPIFYNATVFSSCSSIVCIYQLLRNCPWLFLFHTAYVHTMHWFSLYLCQLNELDPLP